MTSVARSIVVLALLFATPASAVSSNDPWNPAFTGKREPWHPCTRMKARDYLAINGHRVHAERYVECIIGHYPNVDSVLLYRPRS